MIYLDTYLRHVNESWRLITHIGNLFLSLAFDLVIFLAGNPASIFAYIVHEHTAVDDSSSADPSENSSVSLNIPRTEVACVQLKRKRLAINGEKKHTFGQGDLRTEQ